eukprot:gene22983-1392_t
MEVVQSVFEHISLCTKGFVSFEPAGFPPEKLFTESGLWFFTKGNLGARAAPQPAGRTPVPGPGLFQAVTHDLLLMLLREKFFNTTERGMFGDSITSLDDTVGQVLELLKENNLEHNTLVLFTADNGPSLMRMERGGNAGLLRCGKGTTYEGGQRVPAIAKWPGMVAAGHVNRDIVASMDFFVTTLKLSG